MILEGVRWNSPGNHLNKINEVGYYHHDNIRKVTQMTTSRTFLSPEGSDEVLSFISSKSNLSMLAFRPVLTIESHLTAFLAVSDPCRGGPW